MKIIGKGGDYSRTYIVEIHESEILTLGGQIDRGKLQPGTVIDVQSIRASVDAVTKLGGSIKYHADAMLGALTAARDSAQKISESVTPPPEPEKT